MVYTRKLGFEDTPDYDYLRGLFTKVLVRLNQVEDSVFDWMLLDKVRFRNFFDLRSLKMLVRQKRVHKVQF
jgi:hypothetical protein